MAIWNVLRCMVFAATLLSVAASTALADSRPFGVLPEGVLEITSRVSMDSGVELAGGRFVVSGDFNRVDRDRQFEVVLLEPDGTAVEGFAPRCTNSADPAAWVRSCRGQLLALPDGGFLLAGYFGAVDGVAANGLARFDGDGIRVADYDPLVGPSSSVRHMMLVDDWVYIARYGYAGTVRRFGLETGATVDPDFMHYGRVSAVVADLQGRVFVLGDGSDVRRLQADSGDIDPDWVSGVDDTILDLHHDPMTNRLFVLTQSSLTYIKTVRRLDPGQPVGLDTQWSAEIGPAQPGVVSEVSGIDAVGNGQVIIKDTLSASPPVAASQGQRVIAASDGQFLTFLPEAQTVNLLAPLWPEGWLVAQPELRHVDANLAPLDSFEPRLRRVVGLNDVARAPDGRMVIVGAMDQVDGLPRPGLARLNADFSLDITWPPVGPLGAQNVVWPVSPGNTRARVALHASGAAVAVDHLHGAPSGFPTPPQARTVIVDGDGSRVLNTSSHQGETVFGPDGLLYISRPISPWDNLLRIVRANFECSFEYCPADPTWSVSEASMGTSTIPPPVIAQGDGYLYFATMKNRSDFDVDWRVHRVATTPGAVPDPDFVVEVLTTAEFPPRLTLAIDGDHLYIADRIVSIDSVPWVGPARVNRSNGQLDTSWQPGVDRRVLRIAAGSGWVYLIRSSVDTAEFFDLYPLEIVRIPAGDPGSEPALSEQVLTSDGVFTDRSATRTQVAQIIVLDDNRAIVVGHFNEIDGVTRGGFAVVGSVEVIFSDGFEAN